MCAFRRPTKHSQAIKILAKTASNHAQPKFVYLANTLFARIEALYFLMNHLVIIISGWIMTKCIFMRERIHWHNLNAIATLHGTLSNGPTSTMNEQKKKFISFRSHTFSSSYKSHSIYVAAQRVHPFAHHLASFIRHFIHK